ncbi:MAG: hypothetical protein JNL40_17015 [Cyclobacteriaceae bacterium]|nr:hypothetical protein [Cyclobacteriaceae bacterium]
MRKLLYLFLALLLPGLVFVFLKYAGSNRFDIPVLHTDDVSIPAECGWQIHSPYTLPDTVWKYTPRKGPANVVIFPAKDVDPTIVAHDLSAEIGDRVAIINASEVMTDSLSRQRWKSCIFLLKEPRQTVLFDEKGRIRGYYDVRSRDEMDRLRVELKILLEQY